MHAVVADRRGARLCAWGDPQRPTLLRSAAKPFQVLPLIEDGTADRFGLTPRELAVCCGSHNAEEEHLRAVRSILAKAGVDESLLACGPHPSLLESRRDELARAGATLSPVANNCSGKHAAMLALATDRGWPLSGYHRPEHPVQRRIAEAFARWLDVDAATTTWQVDGCGVPTFAVPLDRLARGIARFAAAARQDGAPRRVVEAMTRRSFMVAGTDRLCTRLMEKADGRLFAKTGAEGVYVAGDVPSGVGVALKVEDGAWRAAPCALLGVLGRAGLLSPAAVAALGDFAEPPVANTRGEETGRLTVEEVECSSTR